MPAVRRIEPADIEGLLTVFEAVAAEGRFIGTEPGFDRDLYRRRGFVVRKSGVGYDPHA